MEIAVNYWGILAAAAGAFALGWAWYAPLFGKPWRRMMGITPEMMAEGKKSMVKTMILGALATLLTSYVFAHFLILLPVVNLTGALIVAFWIWLGFVAAIMVNMVLYERKPWSLFLINAGYQLGALLIMAAVLFWI